MGWDGNPCNMHLNELAAPWAGDVKRSGGTLMHFRDFLVVTPDPERARQLTERGIDVLTADPSDEGTLQRANVAEASAVVVATSNDAEDALAILTARRRAGTRPLSPLYGAGGGRL